MERQPTDVEEQAYLSEAVLESETKKLFYLILHQLTDETGEIR